jgi:hypothetical protein
MLTFPAPIPLLLIFLLFRFKDYNVTWLYGPLQLHGAVALQETPTEPSSSILSKSGSLINLNKKPILKNRSISEIIFRKSLSTGSLFKQATTTVQAQETQGILHPILGQANTDYTIYPFSSRTSSQANQDSIVSIDLWGIILLLIPQCKRIHFNEQVEQCIAVNVKGEKRKTLPRTV